MSGSSCSGGWDGVREVASSAELRAATDAARQRGAGVGFVPTMGALHAGHRALLARARAENRFVVASVFVNPLQFGPAEDLASYPRDREADLAVLAAEGTDLAFLPAEGEVWPAPPEVRLRVGALAERLEGLVRPGHLDGVATVVAKLLHLVGPSRAYFGQKDAQQLAVVRRMVDDLAFPNEIVACPTVREPDGLAVSSRNAYLSAPERRAGHRPVPGPAGRAGRLPGRPARPGRRRGGRPRPAGRPRRRRARLRGPGRPGHLRPGQAGRARPGPRHRRPGRPHPPDRQCHPVRRLREPDPSRAWTEERTGC